MRKPNQPPKSERTPREGYRLTAADQSILRHLLRLRMANPELLSLLYRHERGQGATYATGRLRYLYDAGFVTRVYRELRPPRQGGAEYVYLLTPAGAQAILTKKEYHENRRHLWERAQPPEKVAHPLAVATFRVLLEIGLKAPLPRLRHFTADYEHQDHQIEVVLPDSRKKTLWPDSTAVVEWEDGNRFAYVTELQRSWQNTILARDRLLGYMAWLTGSQDETKERLDVQGAFVLFITEDGDSCTALMDRADALFEKANARDRRRFLFSHLGFWYETRKRTRQRSGKAHTYETSVLRDPVEVLRSPIFATLEDEKLRPLFVSPGRSRYNDVKQPVPGPS